MKFSPLQTKLLEVLVDGQPHKRAELLGCHNDELATLRSLAVQLCYLRKKLRPQGQDIICELKHRQIHYRHIRYLRTEN